MYYVVKQNNYSDVDHELKYDWTDPFFSVYFLSQMWLAIEVTTNLRQSRRNNIYIACTCETVKTWSSSAFSVEVTQANPSDSSDVIA